MQESALAVEDARHENSHWFCNGHQDQKEDDDLKQTYGESWQVP